jgi:hypothetical protein
MDVSGTVVDGDTEVLEGGVDDSVVVVGEFGTDEDVDVCSGTDDVVAGGDVVDVVLVGEVVVGGGVGVVGGVLHPSGLSTVAERVVWTVFDQRAVTVSVTAPTVNACDVERVNVLPTVAVCDPAGEYPAGVTIDQVNDGRSASTATDQSTDQP